MQKIATESLASDAITLTEKKVGMALDDIVKMSKNATNKGKKQWRASNKSQKFNGAKANALKVRRYMDSRSAVRQGALAKRRSNFQGNQFPLTTKVAQKAAVAPIRVSAFNSNRVADTNKLRVRMPRVQRRAAGTGFATKMQKQENQEQRGNGATAKQRSGPQTLDTLFANMREQRARTFSAQKNNVKGNGGNNRPRVPWARGRFGN